MDLKIFSQTNGKISKVNRRVAKESYHFGTEKWKEGRTCGESRMNLHL